MTQEIFYITGNMGKLAQVQRDLNFPFTHKSVEVHEIQSLNLLEVVEAKAKEAFAKIGKPVLVDDVALSFAALGKLPGPLVRHFIDEIGNKGICKLIVNEKNRGALAEVTFAFYDGKALKTFHAKLEGTVPDQPRGTGGYGWDPIFIPKGYTQTYAEMEDSERNRLYVRQIPMKDIGLFLHNYIDVN